ncbi:hypothetical protein E2C01_015523 [Portunus trituberculatus]|uniref:Uncharacterized protein n=1 Tax=Portunus trituberculatus TaxID=210409 RepID=A0A5B7DNF7_PORTR|nr:hypothetical protein [Portunus trituberculatus]
MSWGARAAVSGRAAPPHLRHLKASGEETRCARRPSSAIPLPRPHQPSRAGLQGVLGLAIPWLEVLVEGRPAAEAVRGGGQGGKVVQAAGRQAGAATPRGRRRRRAWRGHAVETPLLICVMYLA